MKNRVQVIIIFACCHILTSCFANTSGTNQPLQPIAIEAVSSEEESLLQIQSSPTRFFVDVENNAAAWERAHFFLVQYAGPGRVELQSSSDREQLSKVSKTGFRYQITRNFENGGAQYQVFCSPKQAGVANNDALMNAKNLARFVREGELDLGLIK
jgi:hypothetical protein